MREYDPGMPCDLSLLPPIINEPILLFLVDPMKVVGFEIHGVNSTDIGDIKGEAMGGQKGYRGAGSRRETILRYPFYGRSEMGF